ncbi:MAG: DNA polymerase [Jhaorihella sp.]
MPAAPLNDVVLDAETYFDDEYSLRKMATSTYIRDPRFKEYGWGVKINGGNSVWLLADEFRYFVRQYDWSTARIVGHNLPFDGFVLTHHHGVRPAEWADTLGMARAVICERSARFGLDHLAQMIGRKGKIKGKALNDVKGVRDPSPFHLDQLGSYCVDDVDDTWALYQLLSATFPEKERWVLDWTVRMFTEPKFILDKPLLAELHEEDLARKEALFESLPYTKRQLSSNDQFAEILTELGVDPPTKISKTTGKETYAFAKNDIAFNTLVEEATGLLSDVLEARLAVKSTITETRSARYRDLADEGPWCVPLNYAGAKQTKRFSGGQKQNAQNLSSRGPGAKIRQAIMAPEGYVIYVIDSSNIELRTNACLAGQWDVMDRLAAGEDEYATFAGKIYHRPISKETDKTERNIGKVAVLSLGYQSGAATYRGMLRAQQGLLLPLEECQGVVDIYRRTYARIRNNWYACGDRVNILARGEVPPNLPTNPPIEWFVGPNRQAGVRSLYSGSLIEWNNLRIKEEEDGDRNLVYTKGGSGYTKIYGGKAVENISQFLAREIVNWQTKKIFDVSGFRPQLQVHDEVVYVLPATIACEFDAVAMDCMTGSVDWWPELITGAESAIVQRYGDAK